MKLVNPKINPIKDLVVLTVILPTLTTKTKAFLSMLATYKTNTENYTIKSQKEAKLTALHGLQKRIKICQTQTANPLSD